MDSHIDADIDIDIDIDIDTDIDTGTLVPGVASSRRLLKIIGLFCKRAL